MKKIKAYSVRFAAIKPVGDKSYLIKCFDGSEGFVPISQTFGEDLQTLKSDAIWIAAWVLEKSKLQYSNKKVAWFCAETKQRILFKLQENVIIKEEMSLPWCVNANLAIKDDKVLDTTD